MTGSDNVRDFQIVLDKTTGTFEPGEVLTGRVNLALNNRTNTRGESAGINHGRKSTK